MENKCNMKKIIVSASISFTIILAIDSVQANPERYGHPQCVQEKVDAQVVLFGGHSIDKYILMDFYSDCALPFDENEIYPPAPQECLDAKINAFRVDSGPEAPIRFDVMEEWRKECRNEENQRLEDPDTSEVIIQAPKDNLSPNEIVAGIFEAREREEEYRSNNPHSTGLSYDAEFLVEAWNDEFGYFLLSTPIDSWWTNGSCTGHIHYALQGHVPHLGTDSTAARKIVDDFCKSIIPVEEEASNWVKNCFNSRSSELHEVTGIFPSTEALKNAYGTCITEENERHTQAELERFAENMRIAAQRRADEAQHQAALEANAPTMVERLQSFVSRSPDIEVEWRYMGTDTWLEITATEDRVVLRDVKVNRGNCSSSGVDPAMRYGFGETARINIGCSYNTLREVEVTTNRGTFTYTF